MTVSSDAAPPAQSRAAQRVPDFFIVGHAKCGTTALYEMLRQHPEIYMPPVKEPYFFAVDRPIARKPRGRRWTTLDQTGTRAETFEQYLSLFAAAAPEQCVGEASTHYLWSASAAARIARAQPGARIIAILREPASFVRSLHLQLVQNGAETQKSLRKAIALEPARREGRRIPRRSVWPSALFYSERVRYVSQLERFHAVFPREQVLVLIYEDFVADNEGTVRAVLRFLGVNEDAPLELTRANQSVAVRSIGLQNLDRNVRQGRGAVGRAIKNALLALTSQRLRNEVLHPLRRRAMYGPPGTPDEAFMRELRRRFKPEVLAASDYLKRDLVTLWGYDRLD